MKARAIVPIIISAINNGSQMYNAGDISGCAGLYEDTSRFLLTQGIEGFSKTTIESTLASIGENVSENEKAWKLREAFDQILSNANQMDEREEDIPFIPSGKITVKDILDFSGENVDMSPWYGLHDGVMGGISSGSIILESSDSDGTLKGAVFSGTIRTENNGGFASVRRSVDWDVSSFDGFFIDAYSEEATSSSSSSSSSAPRAYSFNLKDASCLNMMGGVNFKMKFTPQSSSSELSRIFLPFVNFKPDSRGRPVNRSPLERNAIREISLMALKPAGPFRLRILKIGAYKENA